MAQHSLDSIVRETMIDMGETNQNRYARIYNYAVGGLRELRMDVSGMPTTIEIELSNTDSVNLPNDFVSLIRVAVCDGSGNLRSLGLNENMCLPRSADSCGNPITCSSSSIQNLGDVYNFGVYFNGIEGYADNWRNGECMGRMFGLGGGNNEIGSYRVDWERGTINFGHLISGATSIVLEYLSNMSSVNGDYNIHPFMVEALKSWIKWKAIEWKGNNVSADQNAERKYYLAEKQCKRRFNNHDIQSWLQALRFSNKAAPKF